MKRVFHLVVPGAVALLLVAAHPVSAQGFEVRTHTLANGLKILVQEDHSIPNVSLYTFYRIGSRNERPGITGISHFFEHMMFNGAKKYGPGEFDRVMEGAGGANNAYTSQNVTVYQDWFPRSVLETIFDLEADRIRDLSFDPKVVESERGVIASERRNSVEANNERLLSEQLWAAAFTAHTYQWPVLGWMSDIEAWTLDDLKNHFRMGYSPSNATMVVVGDVTFDEIVGLAKKYLESIPSSAPPPRVVTREPEQLGERRVVVRKVAQMPVVTMGYHVPETAHPDYYPLQALETILFSGQSSRLYKRLVDGDQLALSVSGGSGWAFDPTLFTITVRPKAGVDPAAVEKAVYEELDRVKSDAVTGQELEKAKNILLSDFYGNISTINGRSNALGTYEVFFGDYRKLFTAADDFARVTTADVQRVAGQYFTDRNRTVAVFVPEAAAPNAGQK
jgi:zinc protease